jgi:DNA-binding beta-propeller fold protein YncE
MIISYLRTEYRGAYSKKLYAPAGTRVYILKRRENMVLVIDPEGQTFWINSNNLTPIKNATTTLPRKPTK